MKKIQILLADDDEDDRIFFKEALYEAEINSDLITVENGQQLTDLLSGVTDPPPPHIIFLDINMPYKNGKVCLQEIRKNDKFNHIPVVMFSTSWQHKDIDDSYLFGANMYISKSDFFENEIGMLKKLFTSNWEERLINPSKEKFVLKAGY